MIKEHTTGGVCCSIDRETDMARIEVLLTSASLCALVHVFKAETLARPNYSN